MKKLNVNDVDLHTEIDNLVLALHSQDGLQRQQARLALVQIGRPSVPFLVEALHEGNRHARWEAAEALVDIRDPTAAAGLVECLKDDDMNVRGAAARALIALDRAALPPLLEALITGFDSPRLRQGAHHVLHALKKVGHLQEAEVELFHMLHGLFPNTQELPWQAAAALEALGRDIDKGALPGEK